jgi:hypothetical protein
VVPAREMSGSPASARVLLLDNEQAHDVFDVVEVNGRVIRARSAFLFEIGEELRLRVEDTERLARVRTHVADADGTITELELTEGT